MKENRRIESVCVWYCCCVARYARNMALDGGAKGLDTAVLWR